MKPENIHPWKRKVIVQTIISRFYVSLPGCWRVVFFFERRWNSLDGRNPAPDWKCVKNPWKMGYSPYHTGAGFRIPSINSLWSEIIQWNLPTKVMSMDIYISPSGFWRVFVAPQCRKIHTVPYISWKLNSSSGSPPSYCISKPSEGPKKILLLSMKCWLFPWKNTGCTPAIFWGEIDWFTGDRRSPCIL